MSTMSPDDIIELLKAIQNISDAILERVDLKSINSFFDTNDKDENDTILDNLLKAFQEAVQEITFELMYYKYKDLALVRGTAKSYIADIIDGRVEYDRQRLNSYGYNALMLGDTLMKVNKISSDYSQIILRAL